MPEFTYVTVRLTAPMLRDLDALVASDAGNALRPVRRPDIVRQALADMIASRRPPASERPAAVRPVARPRPRPAVLTG